jgi:hypothetical protein
VIGYGTGITVGYLAELADVQSVTVAEISSGVLRAAPHFDFANHGASHHPKVTHLRSDAYRALLRSSGRYDAIVSEPSNPWVAGIEMLYSREFLRAARDHLEPGGVYVQWFHLYENDNRSVQLVLQNFAEVFDQVLVWRSQATDVLLVGLMDAPLAYDLARVEQRFDRADVRNALARIGISVFPQLLAHEAFPLGVVHAAGPAGIPAHTLYHPRLSYESGRAFYVGKSASLPFLGYGQPARIGQQRSLVRRYLDRYEGAPPPEAWDALIDRVCAVALPQCPTLVAAWARGKPPEEVRVRVEALRRRGAPKDARLDLVPLMRFFYGDPVAVSASTQQEIENEQKLYFEHYSHALPFAPGGLAALWQHCQTGPGCKDGLRAAQRFAQTRQMPPTWAAFQR